MHTAHRCWFEHHASAERCGCGDAKQRVGLGRQRDHVTHGLGSHSVWHTPRNITAKQHVPRSALDPSQPASTLLAMFNHAVYGAQYAWLPKISSVPPHICQEHYRNDNRYRHEARGLAPHRARTRAAHDLECRTKGQEAAIHGTSLWHPASCYTFDFGHAPVCYACVKYIELVSLMIHRHERRPVCTYGRLNAN